MPTNRETGKDRWRRVPKDYFKGRDRLQNTKLLFSAVALVLPLGWIASGVDWKSPSSWKATDRNSLRANHGTLARVHAAWDNKCEACHVAFEPIDGRGLFASTSSVTNRSSDKLCMSCHAGPSHHSAMIEAEVKSCAECHHDHQGRDASLVRLSNNECTNCHAALEGHIDTAKKDPKGRIFANVARFDVEGHPPFAPEGATKTKVGDPLRDRGKLKFNHALHMMPGLVKKPGDTPYTSAKIPLAAERPRYQGAGRPDDPVRLDCGSCHQLDAGEIKAAANPAAASASFPSRNLGAYYLPATFENSCRACHSLTFDPAMKDVEVPHGVQTPQVVDFLYRTYAAQALSDDPKILDGFVPQVRLPGKSPARATEKKRLDEAVEKALTFMFPKPTAEGPGRDGNSNSSNCLECHYYGAPGANGHPVRVEDTNVPEVWFTHAAFDHTAHRGVSCRECHAGSYALKEDGQTPNPGASRVATDYLNPGIDNCVQCHAPARETGGWFGQPVTSSTGGVSADCTECHRYHNGDRTLQGPGALAQDATVERSIAEFLRGSGGRPNSAPASATKSLRP